MTTSEEADWHTLHADLVETLRHRVPLDVLHSLHTTKEIQDVTDDRCVNATLRRFLVAEKLDVDKASQRLANHSLWRRQHIPEGTISETDISAEIQSSKVFLQPPGGDGRPLVIVKASRHFPNGNVEVCKRFIIYCLETASRACDHSGSQDHKLWAIFDLKGLKWSNCDAKALRACFEVLRSAFPERVYKIWMLDAPLLFDALWKIVSPFVDPVSKSKIKFVAGVDELKRALDFSCLPIAYGGMAQEIPISELACSLGVTSSQTGNCTIEAYNEYSETSCEVFYDAVEDDGLYW